MTGRLSIDEESGTPIFRQLVEQVTVLVAAGLLRQGDILPSTRVLARELKINPMTVSKAYARLRQDGLLSRQHGMRVEIVAPENTRKTLRTKILLDQLSKAIQTARHLAFDDATIRLLLERVISRRQRTFALAPA